MKSGQETKKVFYKKRISGIYRLVFLFLLLFFFLLIDILFGSVSIPFTKILSLLVGKETSDIYHAILFDYRIPKAITALLAGAALSVSGLQMQTVFRNPLAGPYVLGISSGASLGVALMVMGMGLFSAGITGNAGIWVIAIASCMGAGAMLAIILLVSLRIRDNTTILILGILFSGLVSSVISALQYFSNEAMLKAYVIWTMGSLSVVTGSQLNVLWILVLAGLIMSFVTAKSLNTLLLGETYAKSLGLNIAVNRIVIFTATGILTGAVTAFCGPIGFIGIVVPHIARLFFRTSNHFILIPAAMLLGAMAMLISDIISQFPGLETSLPINSVTSIIGIPVVVWIILKNRQFSVS